MAQILRIHQTRYQAAFQFLAEDLPSIRAEDITWSALLRRSHLTPEEALHAITVNGSPPLIFASELGSSVFGQFDPQVPGRIEIGIEVLRQFANALTQNSAKQFLRAKVLHEICHWSCFAKGVTDNDEAGEDFEQDVFGQELLPWWISPIAPDDRGNVFEDPNARAELLGSLLNKQGFAPGRLQAPHSGVFGGVDAARAMPRGFRNNNPGNIRVGPSIWRGLADPIDKRDFQTIEQNFCVFREPEWGLRALAILLKKYKNEYGLDTPRKIISRWAPASDGNDVASYAEYVAAALSISPDSLVDADDNSSLIVMMRAIAKRENGDRPPYAEMQYRTALLLI
jgi:hypothetical protein